MYISLNPHITTSGRHYYLHFTEEKTSTFWRLNVSPVSCYHLPFPLQINSYHFFLNFFTLYSIIRFINDYVPGVVLVLWLQNPGDNREDGDRNSNIDVKEVKQKLTLPADTTKRQHPASPKQPSSTLSNLLLEPLNFPTPLNVHFTFSCSFLRE